MDLTSLLLSLLTGLATAPDAVSQKPASSDAGKWDKPAVSAPFIRPLWPPLQP